MAAEEVTAAMDKDINDHNEAGGHQDWPYREIVAIAGIQELINIQIYRMIPCLLIKQGDTFESLTFLDAIASLLSTGNFLPSYLPHC